MISPLRKRRISKRLALVEAQVAGDNAVHEALASSTARLAFLSGESRASRRARARLAREATGGTSR